MLQDAIKNEQDRSKTIWEIKERNGISHSAIIKFFCLVS
jgi:hypothetical protein